MNATTIKTWSLQQILDLYQLPFMDLLWQAQQVHRTHHNINAIQLSSLLSIKTGGCPEDCSYCPQSSKYQTEVDSEPLLDKNQVLTAAQAAKNQGAQRFCMGAAWRSPSEKQVDQVIELVKAVKAMGLETCVTLGMLKNGQAERLKEAGLDYYNHNLDSAEEFYPQIISTRTYQDRLDTLDRIQQAGLKSCVGGIIGLGESREQRAKLLLQLANRNPYPDSVPINQLVKVAGTPLANTEDLDEFEFIRTIAIARITMPTTSVRLSAGRSAMNDATQALCFLAGANSIFYGDQLLTTDNPQLMADQELFSRLGLHTATAVLPANSSLTQTVKQFNTTTAQIETL